MHSESCRPKVKWVVNLKLWPLISQNIGTSIHFADKHLNLIHNDLTVANSQVWVVFGRHVTEMQEMTSFLRGGADKSLARPGRKQATATKLGIYSTYSPRSSVHFLILCCNFCKPLKKIQNFVRPSRSPRQQWPPRRTKNGVLSIVLSFQGTGGSPTGSDPENRVCDQDTGSPGRPVGSGLQVPVSRGILVQEQETVGEFPAIFFLQNVPQLHQQRWITLRVYILAPWKIINEENAVLIPKNLAEKFSSGLLHTEFFGAVWAAMPPINWLLLCLRLIVI